MKWWRKCNLRRCIIWNISHWFRRCPTLPTTSIRMSIGYLIMLKGFKFNINYRIWLKLSLQGLKIVSRIRKLRINFRKELIQIWWVWIHQEIKNKKKEQPRLNKIREETKVRRITRLRQQSVRPIYQTP